MEAADDWITVKEATAISGYSPQYLRRLIRNQRLLARKFGPVWQVSRTALMTYIEQALHADDQRWGPKPIDSNDID